MSSTSDTRCRCSGDPAARSSSTDAAATSSSARATNVGTLRSSSARRASLPSWHSPPLGSTCLASATVRPPWKTRVCSRSSCDDLEAPSIRSRPMSQVRLRAYTQAHAQSLFEAARESVGEVHRWLPWCHANYALSEAQNWIAGEQEQLDRRSSFQFAIESDQGLYLGGCGLNQINELHRFANLGYWIRSSRTRQGHASQAVRLLAEWAFSNTELVRLEIVAAVGNRASQRVAAKAGAVREGVLRKRLRIHGVSHDAVVFSITRAMPAA